MCSLNKIQIMIRVTCSVKSSLLLSSLFKLMNFSYSPIYRGCLRTNSIPSAVVLIHLLCSSFRRSSVNISIDINEQESRLCGISHSIKMDLKLYLLTILSKMDLKLYLLIILYKKTCLLICKLELKSLLNRYMRKIRK